MLLRKMLLIVKIDNTPSKKAADPVTYKIHKERYKEFEAVYERLQESLKASPHRLGYEISHCVEDPDYYTLRIEWDFQWTYQRISYKSRI